MHLHFNSSILDYIHLTPPTWSITTTTMKVCSILFSLLDIDNTNRLEEYQIRALLIYFTNMYKNQMSTIIYKLDLDRSGAMELEEFFLLITLLLANKDKKEKEFMHAHSKTVFELLDEDSSGTITVEEFQRLGFLFNLDNREIRIIFKEFDISGDDALDYSEFRMFTIACINKQKSMKKKRFKTLLQRRFSFLAKQRLPILKYINQTINECVPGLIVYDQDDTIPCVTLPMDMKFRCQQSNPYHQKINSIDTNSPLIKTLNYDEDIFSDMFESIYIPQTNDSQSIKSQSFTSSHYSLFNY
ncbi:unnamed protein product [Rotaria sp. Silwood1]|nr:unnamed protein product [Rotaria sp. Silwood1]CAF1054401.1 unnamed protein product [Rotaria sp. Silwood1]CAF3531474.1 unnamed protein product [Rotaria sp. Silwood1]CAF4726787.1 unnamed protein product [Rotaria sp. Silwood1]CAF4732984.1 unnamed protein product [Rotaria sp. Silwood1]